MILIQDQALVRGRRDNVVSAGLKGVELNEASYKDFWKRFRSAELKCPLADRKTDAQKMQMIGNLFFMDPGMRKVWGEHINAPNMVDGMGVRRSGPPQTLQETKELAEKLLRSEKVINQIGEKANALSEGQQAVLMANNINPQLLPYEVAIKTATALLADPRKAPVPPKPALGEFTEINVPSSCEAEIQALSEAAKDVVYLRKFVRGLEPKIEKAPTVLSTDNKAARDLSYNPEHHNRSKHIERRHFYIRDMVEAQEIVVPLVGTQENDADFFTKPLAPKRFKFLRRRVMNLDSREA